MTLDAGESADVEVVVPARELAYYDDGWRYEPGYFDVHVGFSIAATPAQGRVELI